MTYKRKLLKWSTGDAPTGRYASFHNRSWPTATDHNGNTAASLSCSESYTASMAKHSGEHDITVRIANWTNWNQGTNAALGAFVWMRLKATFKNAAAAKAAAEAALIAHPHYVRNDEQHAKAVGYKVNQG